MLLRLPCGGIVRYNGFMDGDKTFAGIGHIESGGSSRAKHRVTWPFTNENTGMAAITVSQTPPC